MLPHSAGNSVTVESRNEMPGIVKWSIRLQIVLPQFAGNSVKVRSGNERPEPMVQFTSEIRKRDLDLDHLVLSQTSDFATPFCR